MNQRIDGAYAGPILESLGRAMWAMDESTERIAAFQRLHGEKYDAAFNAMLKAKAAIRVARELFLEAKP